MAEAAAGIEAIGLRIVHLSVNAESRPFTSVAGRSARRRRRGHALAGLRLRLALPPGLDSLADMRGASPRCAPAHSPALPARWKNCPIWSPGFAYPAGGVARAHEIQQQAASLERDAEATRARFRDTLQLSEVVRRCSADLARMGATRSYKSGPRRLSRTLFHVVGTRRPRRGRRCRRRPQPRPQVRSRTPASRQRRAVLTLGLSGYRAWLTSAVLLSVRRPALQERNSAATATLGTCTPFSPSWS